MTRWFRVAVTCTAFVVGLTVGLAAAAARQATVTLNDGQTFTGELVSDNPDAVTLKIAGVVTRIDRTKIAKVHYLPTIAEQYRQKRAQIADSDLDGRYNLARWLYDHKAFDLAQKELKSLIAGHPDQARAVILLKLVDEQIAAQQQQQPAPENDSTNQQSAISNQQSPAATPAQLPTKKLTKEDINRIRVYEIDLNATPAPLVSVPTKVIDDLFAHYADNTALPQGKNARQQFRGLPSLEQLRLIFQVQARELYPRVIVRNDPPAMIAFRARVDPRYVVGYCATANCHGGKNAGSLFLFRDRPNSVETAYTNFYILHASDASAGYMINRQQPGSSLLLQYGLPRDAAQTPHPPVHLVNATTDNWHPYFTGTDDPQYRMVVDWIQSLYSPTPHYGIHYPLPRGPAYKAHENATAPPAPAPGAAAPAAANGNSPAPTPPTPPAPKQ